MNNSLKGQSGTVLLVAVTLGVLLSGFVAIALTQQLPPLFAEKVNDAGPITDVEARADYLLNGYLEQSAKFSYYEAAYKVGDYEQAETAAGIPAKFGSGHGGYSSGGANIANFYTVYFNWIENEGSSILDNYVTDLDSAAPRCRITKPTGSYELGVVREKPRISVDSGSDEPLIKEVACSRPTITSNYSVNQRSIDMKTQNSHLHNMAIATSRGMGGMWNKSEDIKDSGDWDGQVDETSSCYPDSTFSSNAESEAKSDAEDSAYNQVETYVDNIAKEGKNEMQAVDSGSWGIFGVDIILDLIYKGFDRVGGNPYDGVHLHDNDTSVSLDSTTTLDCDGDNSNCENWSCETGFTKYNDYDGDDMPGCSPPPNSISYTCDSGEHKIGNDCYNSSTSPHHVVGSPTCDSYEGYSTSRSGGTCVVDSPPNPSCTNWEQKVEATYNYELERVEYNTSVLDESTVPTSASANTRLPIKRRFIYDFY